MSEIKTDKLTGVGTAGVILVTGEGNSTTTNLQQGLTKAWADYVGGSTTINDSFNLSSVTDQATGDVILTWANNASNAFYQFSYSGTKTQSGSDSYGYGFKSHGADSATLKTTASHRFDTGYLANADSQDIELSAYAWNGDLA